MKRIAVIWVIVLLGSCQGMFMDTQESNTPQNNFDLLWKIFDEHYCFFEEKGVDWNRTYSDYNYTLQAYANENSIYTNNQEDASSEFLFSLMTSMLFELRDGHITISNNKETHSYNGWYIGYMENYDEGLVNQYRNQSVVQLDYSIWMTVLSNDIGYIRYPSFSEKINRSALDQAMSIFNNCKGVIIDVRGNGGGQVSEAYMLASRFAQQKTHVGYMRYKTGKGHDDFSDYLDRYVEPEGNIFQGKVAVLTNRKVYSAANLFVSIMKSLPNVRIIGDQTGGGGGITISSELYNGWKISVPVNPVYDTYKKSIEEGIEPHEIVMLSASAGRKPADNIIERAKEWISSAEN